MVAQKWHTLSICVPMNMMDDTKEIKRESCSVSTMITDDVVPECLMLQLSKKIFKRICPLYCLPVQRMMMMMMDRIRTRMDKSTTTAVSYN